MSHDRSQVQTANFMLLTSLFISNNNTIMLVLIGVTDASRLPKPSLSQLKTDSLIVMGFHILLESGPNGRHTHCKVSILHYETSKAWDVHNAQSALSHVIGTHTHTYKPGLQTTLPGCFPEALETLGKGTLNIKNQPLKKYVFVYQYRRSSTYF